METVEVRLDRVDATLARLETDITGVAKDCEKLSDRFERFEEKQVERLDGIAKRIDTFGDSISARIDAMVARDKDSANGISKWISGWSPNQIIIVIIIIAITLSGGSVVDFGRELIGGALADTPVIEQMGEAQ